MKIIFLDIDGVLDIFDPDKDLQELSDAALEGLKRIAAESGAKIVIISDWRYGSEKYADKIKIGSKYIQSWERLAEGLKKYDLEIYDVTPWEDRFETRSDEIMHYLNENPGITNYVILDDCYSDRYEKYDELKSRLVFVDANAALQECDVEMALNILNRPELKRVTEENAETFHRLMIDYARELDKNQGRCTDGEILKKWTDSMIAKQGEDRFLRLCFSRDGAVGFVYGKVDREGDMGFIRPGYGYVMELYVIPEYRRRGIGRLMTDRLEDFFAVRNAKGIYLTADPVTGKPFWEAMGYICTGERSPENGLYFYEKQTTAFRAEEVMGENYKEFAGYAVRIYGENIAPLHGSEIPCEEWETLFSSGDRDERHFIIFMNGAACGYLKVNGLEGSGCGWISLLAVSPDHKRRGAGAFAVGFAEEVLRGEGKKTVCINTTADNIPAMALYEKCGYEVSGRRLYVTGDGVKREGVTFSKEV